MRFFNQIKRKPKRARKTWWETAAEQPADEPFYEPAGSAFDPQGIFDPLGSYTGTDMDGGEPEQDADDL